MLTIRGLTRPGLSPVDLELAGGECVAVLGPSGGGKTLLLRAIADLDPNEGELSLDGESRAGMSGPEWRGRVRYLASEPGWWAERIGAHFADAEAAMPLLAGLGLGAEALDWTVSRASTGERQRLALARTLARTQTQAPEVLLLDEPSSGLDPAATEMVEAMLRQRLAAGTAILIATHDPAQAGRLARRRLIVEAGKVREEAA